MVRADGPPVEDWVYLRQYSTVRYQQRVFKIIERNATSSRLQGSQINDVTIYFADSFTSLDVTQ
jgi:hypothetical protein